MSRRELARLMHLAAFMLSNAADDVADGFYTRRERANLADGLDQLCAALRDDDRPTVIDATLPPEKL